MKAEREKLKRLQRLEKLRAIAKQSAATDAAQAENTLAQLSLLSERTHALKADYAARTDMADGSDLVRMAGFVAGLQGIANTTDADVNRARVLADKRQAELVAAERRRAAVEERATQQARDIAAKTQYAALMNQISGRAPAPKETGTDSA